MKILYWVIATMALLAFAWFLQSPYDPLNARDVAIEKYLDSQDYNAISYKCAEVREYANGKTTIIYNRHKKGC
jgi:hypothetical protein